MSTAIVTSYCDRYIDFYKNNNLTAKSHIKPVLDRKALGAHIGFPNVRRNSGASATTTNSINLTNKLNNSSMLCLNESNALLTNNQSAGGGHRKLDRSLSEPVERSNSQLQQQQQQQQRSNSQSNSSRYKTELCRPFEENGTCKYGDKCQFAHGANELRTLARHPKYKTELCRTFHTTGLCPYGPRCHFIHNADESRKMCGPTNPSSPPPPPFMAATGPRPKALSIGSFSLGSAGESSPPSSLSESPTSMGSFFDDIFVVGISSSTPATPTTTTVPGSAANNASQVFAFTAAATQDFLASEKQSAYNRVWNQLSQMNPKSSSATQIYNQRNLNHDSLECVFRDPVINNVPVPGPETSPSPVGSLLSDMDELSLSDSPTCTSPLDVSRNLRLPIFSQLSVGDD